jgi:hypothetical protein
VTSIVLNGEKLEGSLVPVEKLKAENQIVVLMG